jgi:hypothetical protein
MAGKDVRRLSECSLASLSRRRLAGKKDERAGGTGGGEREREGCLAALALQYVAILRVYLIA